MPEHLPFLGEGEKQFLTEFDFKGEAANLLEVRKNMLNAGFASDVVVPEPIPNLCSKRVLVMERLRGTPIMKIFRDRLREMAKERGKTLEEFESEIRQSGVIPKSSTKQSSGITFGLDGVLNVSRSLWNFTGGWVIGTPFLAWQWRTVDITKIHELICVCTHQMLIDGCFNMTTSGNLLLLEDGRIGLIDYGQTKRIDSATRKGLARLIVAFVKMTPMPLFQQQWLMVCAHVMDPWVVEMHSRIAFDNQDQDSMLGGLTFKVLLI